ncbi:MAG: 2-oxoglutarate dehydrogenase E1 [Anaerolineaceae bacterium]|nr:2-oxoglutarate dehydrogenase E1 [Anaerolineaceae bacterium]
MKTLSIRQPYASLIMAQVKRFETRSWNTGYRGKITIHAAKGYDAADRDMAAQLRRFPEARAIIDADLPLGCVLGIVELRKVYRTHELLPRLSPMEHALGNYEPGRYAWLVKVVDIFPQPVPAVGKLGLWEWSQS